TALTAGRRAVNEPGRLRKQGIDLGGQGPVRAQKDEPDRIRGAGPDAELRPAREAGAELHDKVEVGMVARWGAGGWQCLDFAQERANHVDEARKCDASQVGAGVPNR